MEQAPESIQLPYVNPYEENITPFPVYSQSRDCGDGACRSRFCSPLHHGSLWRRQQLSELVVALGRAVLHAGFDNRLANLLRLIPHRDCERRLAILLEEDQRVERLARVIVERLGADEALRRHDLLVDAAHPHLLATGATQHGTPGAARLQIDLADRQRPASRPEPTLEQLGLGQGVEDQAAGSVENARHYDLPLRGRSYF